METMTNAIVSAKEWQSAQQKTEESSTVRPAIKNPITTTLPDTIQFDTDAAWDSKEKRAGLALIAKDT